MPRFGGGGTPSMSDGCPDVCISSLGGRDTAATVDGVMIPCTKITWTFDSKDSFTRCELEVPRVGLNAEARNVVIKYAEHKFGVPLFTWDCPCGASQGHPNPETAFSSFHDPAQHAPHCTYVTPRID